MNCPSCGHEVAEQARFCSNCGHALSWENAPSEPLAEEETGAPDEPRAPHAGDEWAFGSTSEDVPLDDDGALGPPDLPPQISGDYRGGPAWVKALGLGSLSFVVVLLLGLVVAFVAFFEGDAKVADIAKVGGMLFYGFHHVGIQADLPTFDPTQILPEGTGIQDIPLGPFEITYKVAIGLLLGTLLAAFLLYRAGRRVAEEGGGTPLRRILQGATVAVPYAVLSLLLSFLVSFEIDVPQEIAGAFGFAGSLTLKPSAIPAFVWPLVIGAIAGAAGGYAAARADLDATRPKVAAALAGGARMLGWGLVIGFAGLLVLAGASPDVTASYFEGITSGRSGLALLLFTALATPNLAVWGLSVGMGGSLVIGDYFGGSSVTLLSLTSFPNIPSPESLLGGAALGGVEGLEQAPFQFGNPPAVYYVFVLVPLVATILGGRAAARRAGAARASEGAMVGATAGIVFAAGLVLLSVLSGIGLKVGVGFGGGGVTEQLGRLGPTLLIGAVLALLWGVIGGALGGATGPSGGPSRPRRPRREPGGHFTEERTPEPAGVASGGGTGFEGLAAGPTSLSAPPSPEETVVPADVDAEAALPSGEAPAGEETPSEQPPELGPEPADTADAEAPKDAEPSLSPADASEETPVFEFATPATQYGRSREVSLEPDAQPESQQTDPVVPPATPSEREAPAPPGRIEPPVWSPPEPEGPQPDGDVPAPDEKAPFEASGAAEDQPSPWHPSTAAAPPAADQEAAGSTLPADELAPGSGDEEGSESDEGDAVGDEEDGPRSGS